MKHLSDQPLLAFRGRGRPISGNWADRAPAAADPAIQLDAAQADTAMVTFADATRNLLVTGTTGSGKTTGVVKPALERLIESGASGLVLDVKGDYVGFAERYPERVSVVGVGPRAQPINLLAGMSPERFRALLDYWRQYGGLRHEDGYWGSQGVEDALLVFYWYQAVEGREPTLVEVAAALENPVEFAQRFDDTMQQMPLLESRLAEHTQRRLGNAFSILAQGRSKLRGEVSIDDRGELDRQYTWHASKVVTALRPFSDDPLLRRALCAGDALDWQHLLYVQRKVLILNLPESRFGQTAYLVAGLLRMRCTDAIKTYTRHREEGYGRSRFTFLLMDEYQQYALLDHQAVANGTTDDNTWLDRSREYGHINILSTQGVASIQARAGLAELATVDSLLQNCGTHISFASHDPATQASLRRRTPGHAQSAITDTLSSGLGRGQALLASAQLQRHPNGIIATVSTGGVAGYPHMGRFLHAQQSWQEAAVPPQVHNCQVPNPFRDPGAAPAAPEQHPQSEKRLRRALRVHAGELALALRCAWREQYELIFRVGEPFGSYQVCVKAEPAPQQGGSPQMHLYLEIVQPRGQQIIFPLKPAAGLDDIEARLLRLAGGEYFAAHRKFALYASEGSPRRIGAAPPPRGTLQDKEPDASWRKPPYLYLDDQTAAWLEWNLLVTGSAYREAAGTRTDRAASPRGRTGKSGVDNNASGAEQAR